jgi:hypothetical protein
MTARRLSPVATMLKERVRQLARCGFVVSMSLVEATGLLETVPVFVGFWRFA